MLRMGGKIGMSLMRIDEEVKNKHGRLDIGEKIGKLLKRGLVMLTAKRPGSKLNQKDGVDGGVRFVCLFFFLT